MQLAELTWPAVQALPRDLPIAIPVAALEQHGRHLPVFTDAMLLGEVVRRAAEQLQDEVLFTPVMWLGNSEHHLDFPGTMSASPRVYLNLLRDMAENFLRPGFRRIVFLNGHGGNIVPGQQALFELRQKYRDRDDLTLLFATYWTLGGEPPPIDQPLVQTHMGHACEWETSMMLRLAPHLVGDVSSLSPVNPEMPFHPAHQAWTTRDRSTPGHLGHPEAASAEKGERLFQTFAAEMVRFLRRVAQAPTPRKAD